MKTDRLSGRQFLLLTSMVLLSFSACFTSCRDDFDFQKAKNEFQLDVENFFDFSTVQSPKVSVNIQDAKTSTLFNLYAEDPFSYGPQGSFGMKNGVQALYTNFTKADGTWSGDVELPSYAKELYLVYKDISGWHTLKSDVVNGFVEFNSSATKATTRAMTRSGSTSYKVINVTSKGIGESDEWRSQLRVVSNTTFNHWNYFEFSFKVYASDNSSLSIGVTNNADNYYGKILENQAVQGGQWNEISVNGYFYNPGQSPNKFSGYSDGNEEFMDGQKLVLYLNNDQKADFYFKDFSLIFSNDGNQCAQIWNQGEADGTQLDNYFYQYQPGDNYQGGNPQLSTLTIGSPTETHILYTDAVYESQTDAANGTKKSDAWREWLGEYSTTGMSGISDLNAYRNDANMYNASGLYRNNWDKFNGGLSYANILKGANGVDANADLISQLTFNNIAEIVAKHDNVIKKNDQMECDRWHNWQWVCPEDLRQGQDIRLENDGQVSITMLANYSAWASSLAYYYYTGNAPTSLNDIKPIMIAPCTLFYPNGVNAGEDLQNTMNTQFTAMPVGTVVQLKYYGPNVEENYSGDQYTFPANTKIGFLLKTHAWQGDNFNSGGTPSSWETSACGTLYRTTTGALADALNAIGENSAAKKNWYSETAQEYEPSPTDEANPEWNQVSGLYYGNREGGQCHGHVNSGEKHTGHGGAGAAAYTTTLAQHAILSFEDHTNDENYNDIVFGVKTTTKILDLPTPPDPEEYDGPSSSAVYTFEDLWPLVGDYDMNDVMLDVKESVKLLKVVDSEKNENTYLSKQIIKILPYENYASNKNGLALRIGKNETSGDIPALSGFIIKAKTPGASALATLSGVEIIETSDDKVLFITDDIKRYSYSTNRKISTPGEIEITIEFPEKTLSSDFRLTFEPFIFKWEDDSKSQTWEVHLSNCAPTSKFKTSYFDSDGDDKSGLAEDGQMYYFVRNGNYPFAIKLKGTGMDATAEFQGLRKLLDKNLERTRIDEVFPDYMNWVNSRGQNYTNWYLLPNSNNATTEN